MKFIYYIGSLKFKYYFILVCTVILFSHSYFCQSSRKEFKEIVSGIIKSIKSIKILIIDIRKNNIVRKKLDKKVMCINIIIIL